MSIRRVASRRGGLKGGAARAQKLSAEERAAIAKKAAESKRGAYKDPSDFKLRHYPAPSCLAAVE